MYNFYGKEGGRGEGGDEGEGERGAGRGVACALYIRYRIIINLHWQNSLWLASLTTSQLFSPRNARMHNHMH